MFNVLLADRQEIAREGVKAMLEKHDDFRIVGEVTTAEGVLSTVSEGYVDLLVVDLACFEPDSIAALREIIERSPSLRVFVLTDDINPVLARRAIAAGALGYCSKGTEISTLATRFRLVACGRPSIEVGLAELLATELTSSKFGVSCEISLTSREYDVYLRLVNGESYMAIACALEVSAKTVATHKSRIFAKLRINCLSGLVLHAIQNDLLAPRF